jgi:hypothetical protein
VSYAPDAILNAWNIVKTAMPQAELGGIQSNTGAGYHPSRNEVPPSDYSVQQPYDQGGNPNAASALDITLRNPADMALVTQRMIDETQANGDTGLLRGCRSFFGTVNGYTVTGMDVPGRYWVTSDPSHLWHLHTSGKRNNADDTGAWADIASVVTGLTTPIPTPEGRTMKLIRATDELGDISPGSVYAYDGLTCVYVGDPAQLAALILTYGDPVDMQAGNIQYHRQTASAAQRQLISAGL